jgi:hypothetical protein
MKSLEEIKQEVANDTCCCDWKELISYSTIDKIEEYWTKAATNYANQFTERGVIIIGGQRTGRNEMLKVIAAHPGLPLIIANVNHNPKAIESVNFHEDIRNFPDLPPLEIKAASRISECTAHFIPDKSKFLEKPKRNYKK